MNTSELALKAAQGQDTEDLLNHIAWTDVILPKLIRTKEQLTNELVGAVLNPQAPQNKEQIAGKIQGIDFVVNLVTKLVREGRDADATLKSHNLSLR